jgi:hypothetical protein
MTNSTPHISELIWSIFLIFICVAIILGFMFSVVYDVAKDKRLKSFRTQLHDALKNRDLNYDDLQQVSERWKQDRKVVLQSLRIVFSDSLATNTEEGETIAKRARNLIDLHNKSEPYSELPENISMQLDQLNRLDDRNRHPITQLASSLSSLYTTTQLENLRQKRWSFWGFVCGIFGLLSATPSIIAMFK